MKKLVLWKALSGFRAKHWFKHAKPRSRKSMVGDDESLEVEIERSGKIQEEKATQLGGSLDMGGEGERESMHF